MYGGDFGWVVGVVIWMLDNVVCFISVYEVLVVKCVNDEMCLIGLGVMGLYFFLVGKELIYGLFEVFEFVDVFFVVVYYYVCKVSMEIVCDIGFVFSGFEGSCY